MVSDRKAGESGEALATDLRNLKSRGPSSVQAKGFRAKIITILYASYIGKRRIRIRIRIRRRQNWRYRQ